MKKTTFFALLLFSTYCMGQDGLSCTNAIPVSAGAYTVDEVNGDVPNTICTDTPDAGTNGKWYVYTNNGTDDLQVTISSDLEVNAGGDTRFHVYTGDCNNLTCLAGDDDSGVLGGGFLSITTIIANAGESYIIAWDDHWSPNGFDFEITENDLPPPGETTFLPQSISTTGAERAMVDMNGDFLDDLVAITGTNININYQLETGGFNEVNITTTPANFTPSWSLAAGDFDANGFNDLLYGGGNGVTFMQANSDGTAFTEISGSEYVFSQRSNFIDLNNDGHLDAFVCHDVEPNVYYINDGNGNLEFFQGADPNGIPSGLGLVSNGGNYGTVWIDYDNDRDMDLFIAKCRGGDTAAKINELHRNNGDGTYTNVAGDAGVNLADPVQTWSAAWGDYDNDGDMDGYIGASSIADGPTKYMRNNGDGTFTDISGNVDLSNTPLGIENAPADFNNDGYIDILSNGVLLLNDGDGLSFTTLSTLIPPSGAIGDANNDGFLDIFSNGLYLNNGNDNNWLKVVTIGTESNINGIGARIEVTTNNLGTQIRDVRSGEGFRYMSTLNAHFGLGEEEEIESVTVYWPSGNMSVIENPAINETLIVNEDDALSLEDLSDLSIFTVFPNPSSEFIQIKSTINLDNAIYTVFTIEGKRVLNGRLENDTINIQNLATGTYFVRLISNDKVSVQKILKN